MIFHITTEEAFLRALETETYRHESLKSEGYIHCSTKSQLQGVAERQFAEAAEVFLLHLAENRLADKLKWEENVSLSETFPHVYGPIDVEAIEDVSLHLREENGQFDFGRLPGKGEETSPETTEPELEGLEI